MTDIHLDFLGEPEIEAFHESIRSVDLDGVLVGGDIAHAALLESTLLRMQEAVGKPLWFVLGNHDFYGSGVAAVRERMVTLSGQKQAVWLGAVDVVELTPDTGLVGHDGWGDARFGDHAGSTVILNDFYRIAELDSARGDKTGLGQVLARLGDESAEHLRCVLPDALDRYPHVLVLTHVPPFREACWHEGRISGDGYLPYFACKATGDVLLEQAARYPHRELTVLCGHTHSSGECQPLPNLRVVTGGATYGRPAVQLPLIEA